MSKKFSMALLAAGFLLVGVFAASGSAQIYQGSTLACYIDTGFFSVARGEGVNFHVSLDDRQTGAPATVLMRLFNGDGAVVAREDAMLQPGQSATLRVDAPGLYRAHAQVLTPLSSASQQRTVLGIIEIFRPLSPTPDPVEDTFASIIVRMFFADDGRGSTCPH